MLLSNGCSGDTRSLIRVLVTRLLATWTTLVSKMSWLRHLPARHSCLRLFSVSRTETISFSPHLMTFSRLVSNVVLCLHSSACHWWLIRARSHSTVNGLCLPLGNHCILPHCQLDMEQVFLPSSNTSNHSNCVLVMAGCSTFPPSTLPVAVPSTSPLAGLP